MFDEQSRSRMEDIMQSLRTIADLSITPNPVKDVVKASDLTEQLWQDFRMANPTLAALQPNTVSYQVIRGLYLHVQLGAELLPLEQVHLSYTLPAQILRTLLDAALADDLRTIFDEPGAIDLLVQIVTSQIYPPHVVMWSEAEADTVHELLDKLINLDASRPNFTEQLEAWFAEVEDRLPQHVAPHVVAIGQALLALLHPQDEAEKPLGSISATNNGRTFLLDLEQMVRLYDQVRAAYAKYPPIKQPDVERGEVSVAQSLIATVTQLRDQVAMFGMIAEESSLIRNMDSQAKAVALQQYSQDRIRRILERFGRLVGMLHGESKDDPTVRTDSAAQSDKIQDLNSNGLNLLATDDLMFDARYASASLPTHERGGRGEEKGPLVVCLDKSSSMAESDGAKDVWASALVLGAAEEAFRQQRPFALVSFRSVVTKEDVVQAMPPDGAGEIFASIQMLPSGGTNFEAALTHAKAIIEQESRWKDADILFVTDGNSVVSTDFLRTFKAFKQDHKVKVHSVLINMGGSSVSKSSVQQFSDTIIMASDLTENLSKEILDLV